MKSMLKGALLNALLVVPSMAQAGHCNGIMYRHASTTPAHHSYQVATMQPTVAQPVTVAATTPNRTSYSSAFQRPAAPVTQTAVVPVAQMTPTNYRQTARVSRLQEMEHGREVIKGMLEK